MKLKIKLILLIAILAVVISAGYVRQPPKETATTSIPTAAVISPTPTPTSTAAPIQSQVYTPETTATASKPVCDETLWTHVYNSSRLKIIEVCKTVTGTVDSVIKEADGNDHIRLTLDHEYVDLINQGNIDGQHGDLVLETICKNNITQADAQEPCNGFHQNLQARVGEHIAVTGAYVLDSDHAWNEIHPITSLVEIN